MSAETFTLRLARGSGPSPSCSSSGCASPARAHLSERAQRVCAARGVGVALALGERRLAQQIECHAAAALPERRAARRRRVGVLARDEAMRHGGDTERRRRSGGQLQGAAADQARQTARRPRPDRRLLEVLVQVADQLPAVRGTRVVRRRSETARPADCGSPITVCIIRRSATAAGLRPPSGRCSARRCPQRLTSVSNASVSIVQSSSLSMRQRDPVSRRPGGRRATAAGSRPRCATRSESCTPVSTCSRRTCRRRDPNELNPPNGVFIVGYEDELAICCGGIKRLDAEACELSACT